MEYAVCFTGKEKAELVRTSRPDKASPGCVMGSTLYSLISPGTELNHGYLQEQERYYPGYSAVFRVESIGEGVEEVELGEVRFCMGPHRSFQHAEVKHTLRVPAGLQPEEAAVVRLMNIGLTALVTTSAKPGDRVIVSGAGPVGLLTALLFQRCGYFVGLVEPDPERRDLAKLAGLPQAWGHFPVEDPLWRGRTALVVDCSGHEAAVLEGCRMVRRFGEVVLCGVPWKAYTDLTAHELLKTVFHQFVTLRSGTEWELPKHADQYCPRGNYDNMEYGLLLLSEGFINLPLFSRTCSPGQAQEVYASLASRQLKELFILFDWRDAV